MKFILGTKENMAEYFSENGESIPVTIVEAEPVTVTRVFEKGKDGYDAVQVGFGTKKNKQNKHIKIVDIIFIDNMPLIQP